MGDTILDLRRQYQDDLYKKEQDYQKRRMDIEQNYCQLVEKAYQTAPIDTSILISEYVSVVRTSPFWKSL